MVVPMSRYLKAIFGFLVLIRQIDAFALVPNRAVGSRRSLLRTSTRTFVSSEEKYTESTSSAGDFGNNQTNVDMPINGSQKQTISGGVAINGEQPAMDNTIGGANSTTTGGTSVAAAASASTGLSGEVLAINPEHIQIVSRTPEEENAVAGSFGGFVSMFRSSASYIANHRNTLAVYHIPGALLEETVAGQDAEEHFRDLMNDVALTWLLGMKIVLIVGCRAQIDRRVGLRKSHNGMVITDQDTLRVVKEEAGYVRFEVERQLARSLRICSGGSSDGNVVSGNFFSAQPFGVLDGVDYKFSGFVRRVEVEKIRQVHASRDICLLTTLGVSPSGEVFNVNSESLAATVAGALEASKIVFFTENNVFLKDSVHGKEVKNLRLSDARNILQYNGLKMHKRGIVALPDDEKDHKVVDALIKIGWAISALEQGVKRAHMIVPIKGALLQELYTRDGSGTLISRDLYEGIRRANVNDVNGVYDLIYPLIKMGTLIDRPKTVLERDIENYYVYTRDNLIVACGQLKKFEDGFFEIGCMVVKPEYRAQGRGDAMLGYLERLCLQENNYANTKCFVLSTQTMEWFIERGFEEVPVDHLPPSRQATYNWDRASKIYMKRIDNDRELDASELWWNR